MLSAPFLFHPDNDWGTRRRLLPVRFIFRAKQPGELVRLRDISLRLGRIRNGFRHFHVVVRGQFAERERRQVGIIKVYFHETVRGVNGRKSRDACP